MCQPLPIPVTNVLVSGPAGVNDTTILTVFLPCRCPPLEFSRRRTLSFRFLPNSYRVFTVFLPGSSAAFPRWNFPEKGSFVSGEAAKLSTGSTHRPAYAIDKKNHLHYLVAIWTHQDPSCIRTRESRVVLVQAETTKFTKIVILVVGLGNHF